jgi:hypothetical protein
MKGNQLRGGESYFRRPSLDMTLHVTQKPDVTILINPYTTKSPASDCQGCQDLSLTFCYINPYKGIIYTNQINIFNIEI